MEVDQALGLPVDAGPAAPPTKSQNSRPANPVLNVYLDGSESMAGYIQEGRPETNTLGSVIELLDEIQGKVGANRVVARPFGAQVGGEIGDIRAYGRRAAYADCAGCDNNITRIDRVLSRIAGALTGLGRPRSRNLNLIVTDLWQDDPEAIANPEISLGSPLRNILGAGYSVGVVGIPAQFAGNVYFPGGTVRREATARLLVILMIGPRAAIENAYGALRQYGSADMTSQMRFALFTAETLPPTLVAPTLRGPVSRDVVENDRVARLLGPAQQFALETEGARIELALNPVAGVPSHQVRPAHFVQASRVWEMSRADSDLTGCSTNAWANVGALPSDGWHLGPGTIAYHLNAERATRAGLRPDRTYLVWLSAGTQQGGAMNPAPADWMGSGAGGWGGSLAQARASIGSGRLITPGLDRLRTVLESKLNEVLDRPQWHSASLFILTLR